MKIRKASDCCNETAIRLIIWILKPITNNGRAPGWNRSATGAKAGSNWWKFLPSRKFTTTSSPTGYPRKSHAAERAALSVPVVLVYQTAGQKVPGDITATYTGIGGVSGMLEDHKRKFVIDFDILNMQKKWKRHCHAGSFRQRRGNYRQAPDVQPGNQRPDRIHRLQTERQDLGTAGFGSQKGKNISEIWSYQWLP